MRIKYFDKDYIEIDDIKSLARHFSNAHIHMWIEGCGSLSSFAEVQLVKSLSPILLSLLEINKENKKVVTINIIQEIQKLSEPYDKQLLKRLFDTFAFFKKGKFSLKVNHSILSYFSKFRKEVVEESIKTFLDKKYIEQGKDISYLKAIIKNFDQTYTEHKLCTDIYIQVKNEFLPITREYNRLKNPDYSTKTYYGIQLKEVEHLPTLQLTILNSKISANKEITYSDFADIELVIAYLLYNQERVRNEEKLKFYFDLWKSLKDKMGK